MSSTDYNYDEQGQFFPYFVITVTALFTIPISYSALKPSKELENTAPRIQTDFRPEDAEIIEKQRRKQKRRERRLKRMLTALAGWSLMAYMVYLMAVTTRTAAEIWDPYDILGLARGVDEKQITKHYRKLSLTLHPDKVKLDPSKNETVESANDHWVEVTKAFKALTDEEIRSNYELYGHPDGKQRLSIGIALPQFIVTEGNGKYVLLLYGALLGVLLPLLVGRWWYGTQKMTKESILVASAGKLFTEYQEDMSDNDVVAALSTGEELEEIFQGNNGEEDLDKIERKILAGNSARTNWRMSTQERSTLLALRAEPRRKALGLLWAYLGRVDLEDASLNEQKYEAAPVALMLNESFNAMTPLFGNMQPLLASYHACQSLIQALAPGASPLYQLPHVTPAVVNAIERETLSRNHTVQAFMSIDDQKRRKMVTGSGLMTNEQYTVAVKVASQMPLARVEKAFFKVTGEKYVTPGSLIQFVIKLRIIPPGSTNVPPVSEHDLLDIDPKEGDLDALHGRKKGPGGESEKPVQPPLAHAPYFAQDHAPRWRVFLGENKSGKIAVPPFTFSTFDKPIFNADGTPTCNMQTLKMQFQAPPQAGKYPFTMRLVCDSYVGLDSHRDVIMAVEEPTKVEEVVEEDDISEPEEDSLAGQMNALKGGEAPKRTKRAAVAEQSDDDSDTDGDDEEDSDSDTDTDTDEE